MQMLWKLFTLGALLMASSAVADERRGYIMVQNGMCREQSNANVNANFNVTRTVQFENYNNNGVAFITTTYSGNVFLNSSNSTQNNYNLNIDRKIIVITTSPVPTATTQNIQLNVNGNNTDPFNLAFNSSSQSVSFPVVVEYNETDGQSGFQYGNDTVLQKFSLRASPMASFNGLSVQTELQGNTSVYTVGSCNDQGFCFTFHFANSTYVRNGVTYLPDSVKVDFNITNVQALNIASTSNIALLSAIRQTADLAQFMDLHHQVDATVQQAAQTGGVAIVSPDFVAQFNNANGTSAYLNFARTANLTSTTGVVSSSSVMAELVGNKSRSISVLDDSNDAFNSFFNELKNTQYIVFSFLSQVGNTSSLYWDPEVGMAAVGTSNSVDGGASGLSAGAIAGIVIGVVALVALLAVGGFYAHRRFGKKPKKHGLLG